MTPCSGNLRDTSSLGGGLLSGFWLVVAVGVDGEHPDDSVAVADVDESFDFDETDPGTSETHSDLDELASEPDISGGADLAYERAGWVDGFGHFVNAGEPDHVVCDRFGVVAFGWGGVSDALVGPLTVVVEPEPVQQFLEMVYVEGGSFVRKPVFEGAVEPFQLPQSLGVIRRRVDISTPRSSRLFSNMTSVPWSLPVKHSPLSERTWRGSP